MDISHPRPRRLCTYRDRKSTRLNSSHLVISYAVFCLKKKNALKTLRWLLHNVDLPLALLSLMQEFRGMFASEKVQDLPSEPAHGPSPSSKPDDLTDRI